MAIREILTVPDPRLKLVSKPVDAVDDDLRALMDDMAAEHMTWINEMFSGVSEADAARGMSIMLDIRRATEDAEKA